MLAKLKRQGNSRGFLIPPTLLDALGWQDGMELDLSVTNGKLVAQTLAPSLEVLLASIPKDYEPEVISWGPDVGTEIIR